MRLLRVGTALACAGMAAAAGLPAASAARVSVKRGAHYGQRIFPDNAFTVRDARQLTGRRVRFRLGVDYPIVGGVLKQRCTSATYSICDGFAELNLLDGFDLQPRVTVPFTGAIKLASVTPASFFLTTRSGKQAGGFRQLTFDPKSHTLAGISDQFLQENTTYRIHVTSAITDATGRPVSACRKACVVTFTTRTASGELVRLRKALDTMTPSKLTFTQDGKDDVFLAAGIAPSISGPLHGRGGTAQTKAHPKAEWAAGPTP